MKTDIPWSWLKATPPGSAGRIPGLGLSYRHLPATLMRMEQVLVANGEEDLRVVKAPRNRSGWTAPHRVSHDNNLWQG